MQTDRNQWLDHVSHDYRDDLLRLKNERLESFKDTKYQQYMDACATAPHLSGLEIDLDRATIGGDHQLSEDEIKRLENSLKAFIPWKKGPFKIFDFEIDSEWQSQIKWERLVEKIGPLEDQVIADIGCNNGYFMFRMASQKPKMVLGMEPVAKHWFNFHLLNQYFQQENLFFEPYGMEHLDLLPKSFDTIFCLGILYHHTDPIGLLRKARTSLKKGGQLIIDCQGIAGEEPVAYMPPGKYAGGRGFWFLPTLSCLQNWVKRSGFQHVDVLFAGPLSLDEQRTSSWAPIDSLKEFLSPCETKTIEGHPAPHRFYLRARV